jgi:hypothetical protein
MAKALNKAKEKFTRFEREQIQIQEDEKHITTQIKKLKGGIEKVKEVGLPHLPNHLGGTTNISKRKGLRGEYPRKGGMRGESKGVGGSSREG